MNTDWTLKQYWGHWIEIRQGIRGTILFMLGRITPRGNDRITFLGEAVFIRHLIAGEMTAVWRRGKNKSLYPYCAYVSSLIRMLLISMNNLN